MFHDQMIKYLSFRVDITNKKQKQARCSKTIKYKLFEFCHTLQLDIKYLQCIAINTPLIKPIFIFQTIEEPRLKHAVIEQNIALIVKVKQSIVLILQNRFGTYRQYCVTIKNTKWNMYIMQKPDHSDSMYFSSLSTFTPLFWLH